MLKIAEAEKKLKKKKNKAKGMNVAEFFIFALKIEAVCSSETLIYGQKKIHGLTKKNGRRGSERKETKEKGTEKERDKQANKLYRSWNRMSAYLPVIRLYKCLLRNNSY
jgi:hypothetical protein